MPRTILPAVSAIVFIFGLSLTSHAQQAPPQQVQQQNRMQQRWNAEIEAPRVNRVVATVNGRAITSNELHFETLPVKAQLIAQYPTLAEEYRGKVNELRRKSLDQLIDRELVVSEFQAMGNQIKPAMVDEEVKNVIRDRFNGNREKFLAGLKKSHITMQGFRDMTERSLIMRIARMQKAQRGVPFEPGEVEKTYRSMSRTLRDMLKDKVVFEKIYIPSTSDDFTKTEKDQLTLAQKIAADLRGGADFATLAKENSKDVYASDGGKWPETVRTEFPPEFARIIFDAKPGSIVGPLLDPRGFTILRVTKVNYAPAPPLSKVRPQIEQYVENKKSSVKFDQWIARLKERAIIKKKL